MEKSGITKVFTELFRRYFHNEHPIQFKIDEKNSDLISSLNGTVTWFFPSNQFSIGSELSKDYHNAIYKITGLFLADYESEINKTDQKYKEFKTDIRLILKESIRIIQEIGSDGVKIGDEAALASHYSRMKDKMNQFFNNRYNLLAELSRQRIQAFYDYLDDDHSIDLMEKLGIDNNAPRHQKLSDLGKKLNFEITKVEPNWKLAKDLEWLIDNLFFPQGNNLTIPADALQFTKDNKSKLQEIIVTWQLVYGEDLRVKSSPK